MNTGQTKRASCRGCGQPIQLSERMAETSGGLKTWWVSLNLDGVTRHKDTCSGRSTADQRAVPCPVIGCGGTKEPEQVMCKDHWARVSEATQQRVLAGYKEGAGGLEHINAIRDALREAKG